MDKRQLRRDAYRFINENIIKYIDFVSPVIDTDEKLAHLLTVNIETIQELKSGDVDPSSELVRAFHDLFASNLVNTNEIDEVLIRPFE